MRSTSQYLIRSEDSTKPGPTRVLFYLIPFGALYGKRRNPLLIPVIKGLA